MLTCTRLIGSSRVWSERLGWETGAPHPRAPMYVTSGEGRNATGPVIRSPGAGGSPPGARKPTGGVLHREAPKKKTSPPAFRSVGPRQVGDGSLNYEACQSAAGFHTSGRRKKKKKSPPLLSVWSEGGWLFFSLSVGSLLF